MDWNLKSKKRPDDLKLKYRARYYKTRFGQWRRLIRTAYKKDKEANALVYEIEEKKATEEKAKKEELEQAAFEKQENELLKEFKTATESKISEEAIKTLLTR